MVVEPALPQKTYNENMSARTPSQISVDNSMAGQDNETLPPVRDAQGNVVPLNDLTPPDDAMVDPPVPAAVRRATANVQPTGVHYNFAPFQQIAALHQAGRKEEAIAMRDALDPQSRYVYDNIKNMKRVPASEGARLADEFRKMQDERMQAQPQDPTKTRESAQQAARLQGILGIMDTYSAAESDLDNLVGPAVGSWAANEWDKWNDPDRYAKRFELISVTKNEVLEAAKFVKPVSNDERKFLEEMFPRRDDPPQVWRSYFRRSRDILSKGLPEQPQQQGSAPATAPSPQGAAAPPPNLPPTRIDPVTGQTMQLIQNQQGRWVYRMATQQQSQPNVTGR